MENKIGKDFESLSQRILYSYVGTLPSFVAVESDAASYESQKQLYDFIVQMSKKLYSNPETIGIPTQPDGFYTGFELQKTKPGLINSMKTLKKKIDEFYMVLIKVGDSGEINNNRLYIKKSGAKIPARILSGFEHIGLHNEVQKDNTIIWSDDYPDMFPAWKLLGKAAIESKNPALVFSHCMLSQEYPYSKDIFYKLIDNEALLQALEDFFTDRGFKYIDSREDELSMDWYKNYGKKDEPLKASWAEREHGGLSVFYDYSKKNQLTYGLRVPKFKDLLAHFDDMDDKLKAFVVKKTKKCNDCGYCTQTDKSGLRGKQLIHVSHSGEFDLCLLFPGFSYRWTFMDEEITSNIVRFLAFADDIL